MSIRLNDSTEHIARRATADYEAERRKAQITANLARNGYGSVRTNEPPAGSVGYDDRPLYDPSREPVGLLAWDAGRLRRVAVRVAVYLLIAALISGIVWYGFHPRAWA